MTDRELAEDLVVIVKYRKRGREEDNEEELTLALKEKKRSFYCKLFDPTHWTYRCVIQFFVCYITFGLYFSYESPGGLEDAIIKVMKVDTTQYSLLFSVSAWPSVVLCLIGGPLTDRVLGRRLSTVLLASCVTLGQLVWAVGAFVDTFWVMLIGRFLIGVGVRMLVAVLQSFTVVWFKRKQLAFSMSTSATAARLGGAASLGLPQLLYSHIDYPDLSGTDRLGITILLLGGGLMVTGLLVMTPLLVIMDIRGERLLKKDVAENEQKVTAKIKCSELKQFSGHFWLVVFIASIYYSVVYSFVGIGEVFYVQKFSLSLASSGIIVSFVFSATILVTPLMGLLLDATGYYASWVIVGLLFALISHLILLLSGGHFSIPYITGMVYSISYTLITVSLWVLPGLLVSSNQVTTAYGFYYSPYMLFLSILTIISGSIVDNGGYFILEVTYSILLYTAVLAAVLLCLSDTLSKKPVINAPGKYTAKKLKNKIKNFFSSKSNSTSLVSATSLAGDKSQENNHACKQN